MSKKIDALRIEIKALQAERAALEVQRRSRAEVCQIVRQKVDAWHAKSAEAVRLQMLSLARGDKVVNMFHAPLQVHGIHGHADVGALLTGLVGVERMTEYLTAAASALPEGLDTAARSARIAEINSELDVLETEEEALIEASELTGTPVLRRADARPEIVLAIQHTI